LALDATQICFHPTVLSVDRFASDLSRRMDGRVFRTGL
jgi:hypothetical protein